MVANAHNRLTKYGIAGLAGIALLGWIREPERHFGPTEAAGRATFEYRPAAPVTEAPATEFSGNAVPVETTRPAYESSPVLEEPRPASPAPVERRYERHRAASGPVVRQQQPARTQRPQVTPQPTQEPKRRAELPAHPDARERSSRHDFPENRQPEDRIEQAEVRRAEPVIDHSTTSSTVVRPSDRQRTGRQTAMIIGGATAAGAVIGAISGGGKGAAIGAITAGAGGYVYDRMTRNRGASRNSTGYPQGRDDDQDSDDRFVSRFATPGFAR